MQPDDGQPNGMHHDEDQRQPHGAQDVLATVRQEFADTLIRSIEDDDYPSTTQMDLAERSMTLEQRARYIRALIDKVERDLPYPSVPMMQRILSLVGR